MSESVCMMFPFLFGLKFLVKTLKKFKLGIVFFLFILYNNLIYIYIAFIKGCI